MKSEALRQQRILVVGTGLTGASVARFLGKHGLAFDLVGQRRRDESGRINDGLDDCLAQGQVFDELDIELACRYDVLVLSPGYPRASAPIAAALAAGVDVIGDIELFADAVQSPVIAVTGSNGKSTVVAWLASVAARCGVAAVPCGNIGKPALDALDSTVELYVLELSSFQLESTRSLRCLAATVLNVSDDHLDRYDSIAHYAETKRRIFRRCSLRIINADDERTWPTEAEIEAAAEEQRFTLVERSTLSDPPPGSPRWHRDSDGATGWLCRDRTRLIDQDRLALPGVHNAGNALAVLALLEPLGLPMDDVLAALVEYRGLPHRTELVGERDGVRWYNDSKGTNVDACIKAILAMPGPVVLIAGGQGKGADFSPLRATIESHVHTAILIGVDATRIADVLRGATRLLSADSLDEAVVLARSAARAGDVVLLSPACSSFDMFDHFEHRGDCFKASVREVLAA